ncbi:PREDICTED: nucleolar transcription factor 1-A-like [Priapulus caudatus]|uniref:Nucleolar transcription factor 1-A-like n=1 Tax=Priapulus caudatus TaxID=37621 RepID=A0ABM1DPU0_PRICU|nr:PREDICTED: nucleolar transcription factor 1-A-like [Priapulus caudatus]XP_014661960.1 PREDICTED: nucleolar transcription factor 1-A-like [Priapulus caudatus]XP_014661961.1 PREDICTED: nucleolar transcription factor 1-A-like [Priapulus caudatus]
MVEDKKRKKHKAKLDLSVSSVGSDNESSAKMKRNRKRKKKKKRNDSEIEESTDVGPVANEETSDIVAKTDDTDNSMEIDTGWTVEDQETLLEHMLSLLPSRNNLTYSVQMKKLDWATIAFGAHTGDDCQNMWRTILRQLNKYRTLEVVISEAKAMISDPDYVILKKDFAPKKPVGVLMGYVNDHQEKYMKKHPTATRKQACEVLSKKFSALSESKKEKYVEDYEQKLSLYKVQLEKYRAKHNKNDATRKPPGPAPTIPASGRDLFIITKYHEFEETHPTMASLKAKKNELAQEWQEISDKKKWNKWIKKFYKHKDEYEQQEKDWMQSHPRYKPKLKSGMSMVEQRIRNKVLGKPLPVRYPFDLYYNTKAKELQNMRESEKRKCIGKKWKAMSLKKRSKWNKRFIQASVQYKQELAGFLEKLSPEDREAKTSIRSRNKKIHLFQGAPKAPPASSYHLFISDQLHEKVDIQNANRKWSKLDLADRPLYDDRLDGLWKSYESQLNDYIKTLSAQDADQFQLALPQAVKRYLQKHHHQFKGAPKKPPQDPYRFFIQKMCQANKRADFASLANTWKLFSGEERQVYVTDWRNLQKEYKDDTVRYTEGLSEKDRIKYQQLLENQSRKKGRSRGEAEVATQECSKKDREHTDSGSETDPAEYAISGLDLMAPRRDIKINKQIPLEDDLYSEPDSDIAFPLTQKAVPQNEAKSVNSPQKRKKGTSSKSSSDSET